jgi:hypothetical protein
MHRYSYIIPNLKYAGELYKYIKNISGLPSDFDIYIESTVDFIFNQDAPLTSDQISILNIAIANYDPPQILNTIVQTQQFQLVKLTSNNTDYFSLGTLFLNNCLHKLYSVSIISYINGTGSYKLHLYDVLNNIIISESDSVSNNNMQIITMYINDDTVIDNILVELNVIVSDSNSTFIIKSAQLNFIEH